MSATSSIVICLFLRFRGLILIPAIIGVTLLLFAFGNVLLSVIATPKLELSRPKTKPLHVPRKIRAAHWSASTVKV